MLCWYVYANSRKFPLYLDHALLIRKGQLEREKSTSDSLRETLVSRKRTRRLTVQTDQQRTHAEQSARLEAELSIAKTSVSSHPMRAYAD